MLHPQVPAGIGRHARDIVALVVTVAVPLQVAEHGRLAPLGAVQAGGEGQVLALEPDVVQATCGENIEKLFYDL